MNNTLYLILDESLAKGFASNQEQFDGELGVIAGYFVRGANRDRTLQSLEKIFAERPISEGGKRHITDLHDDQKIWVRKKLFEFLDERELPLLYSAISVQGLHANNERMNTLARDFHANRRSNISIPLKKTNERLLTVAFQDLFLRAAAYAIEYFPPDTQISIITDRLDKEICREFEQCADKILNMDKPKSRSYTGFDRDKNQVVTYKVHSQVKGLDNEVTKRLQKLKYSIKCEDSALTFAADILVNSIGYHLKSVATQSEIDLNSRRAISGHPLEHYFWGLSEASPMGNVADLMYRRPSQSR